MVGKKYEWLNTMIGAQAKFNEKVTKNFTRCVLCGEHKPLIKATEFCKKCDK